MFNPSKDLSAIAMILVSDAEILKLLDLEDKTMAEKAKKIIQRSQWNDLVDNKKKLCVFFIPSRKTKNDSFREEILEIDCHVPASQDFQAYKVQERIYKLLQHKKVNNRYLNFEGQLGELATMDGFFCCGSRYTFNRIV